MLRIMIATPPEFRYPSKRLDNAAYMIATPPEFCYPSKRLDNAAYNDS